jgi:hypothetical protein
MDGHAPDIRALLHAVVYPISNEQYVRDQQILSSLFKQPGRSTVMSSPTSPR